MGSLREINEMIHNMGSIDKERREGDVSEEAKRDRYITRGTE